jgi:hypothetical protein
MTSQENQTEESEGIHPHLRFFDTDQDGRISLIETIKGLERLGLGHLLTVPGAAGIHAGIVGLGLAKRIKVSLLGLEIPETGHVRHPDTRFVDEAGQFDEARMDAIFARYGTTFAGEAMTLPEVATMVTSVLLRDAQRSLKDALMFPTGFGAAIVEWGVLFWVSGDQRQGSPVLEKSSVRRFYTDAAFFDSVAERIASERASRSASVLGRSRNALQAWLV